MTGFRRSYRQKEAPDSDLNQGPRQSFIPLFRWGLAMFGVQDEYGSTRRMGSKQKSWE